MNVSERAKNQTYKTVKRVDVGQTIKLFTGIESNINRDSYNSISGKGNTYIELKAHPVQLNPSSKQIDKAGANEYINAIFYISYLEFKEKLGEIPADINRCMIEIYFDGIYRKYNIPFSSSIYR